MELSEGEPDQGAPPPLVQRPPPRTATIGGVGVVLVTGAAILAGLAANGWLTPLDLALAALVVLGAIAGALALAHLIRANPDAIGEARFDTRNPDER